MGDDHPQLADHLQRLRLKGNEPGSLEISPGTWTPYGTLLAMLNRDGQLERVLRALEGWGHGRKRPLDRDGWDEELFTAYEALRGYATLMELGSDE